MDLLPIGATIHKNKQFADHPDCQAGLPLTIDYFNKIGYTPPWIGYFALIDDKLVGSAAFKGKPKEGKVEIAYGAFPQYERQGAGNGAALLVVVFHSNLMLAMLSSVCLKALFCDSFRKGIPHPFT